MGRKCWLVRWLFWSAAAFGLAFNLPKYFMLEQIGRESPPPVTHPEYFYGFLGLGVAWQLGFILIGIDPVRYRPFMLLAAMEKTLVGLSTAVLYMVGQVARMVLVFGSLDVALATLFVVAWFWTIDR